MILDQLNKKGLVNPPPYVISNTAMLVITGSVAYGVADTSTKSKMPDFDCYGFCIPPKDIIFPHLKGEIQGFGTPAPRFDQFQKHGIIDPDAHAGKGQEWDITVFNIVKYFELCRGGNPNMIDTLFVPENCILHSTQVGRMVRDSRKLFISKEIWQKFRGYAWSQMHKMDSKQNIASELLNQIESFEETHNIGQKTPFSDVKKEIETRGSTESLKHLSQEELGNYFGIYYEGILKSSRFEMIKINKYDIKFGYHLLRLLDEAQQLLETGEMDLQRAKEPMKSIRRGEWKKEDIISWAKDKEKELEIAFTNCKLPDKAPEDKLKALLLQCLEEHYGSLSNIIPQPDWAVNGLRSIDELLNSFRTKMYS